MKKWLFCILALFGGCRKIDSDGFQVYVIKQGKHRSGYRYRSDYKNHIEFQVRFNETAIYETKDPNNQADVNKLYGVSDCGRSHMDYSIRFGWRYYQDKLQILWFKHEMGKFSFDVIREIDINETYTCSLVIFKNEYIMCVNDTCTVIPRMCDTEFKRYRLYPYFGGDETAPHDIAIRIKMISR